MKADNEILGIRTVDPMMVYGGQTVNPLDHTAESSLELAQNDTGVLSVQSLTLGTSYGAGTLSLMIMRRLA